MDTAVLFVELFKLLSIGMIIVVAAAASGKG
jgi:hypothetical protein